MAKVTMKMPEDFLIRISKLGDKTDDIVSNVLVAGGEVVLEKIKVNLKGIIGNGSKSKRRSTGELLSSLGLSPAKLDREGNFNVKIGFSEPRSDGESNAKIANVLEYGKVGQPARPFLTPAKASTHKLCIEVMKAKLNKEIEKI